MLIWSGSSDSFFPNEYVIYEILKVSGQAIWNKLIPLISPKLSSLGLSQCLQVGLCGGGVMLPVCVCLENLSADFGSLQCNCSAWIGNRLCMLSAAGSSWNRISRRFSSTVVSCVCVCEQTWGIIPERIKWNMKYKLWDS